MYSQKSWGGDVPPFILITFLKDESEEPSGNDMVGFIVYEWRDQHLLGKPAPNSDGQVCGAVSCDAGMKLTTK